MTIRTVAAILILAVLASTAFSAVTDTGAALVLDNGQLKATISKANGCITSLEGNGMKWDSVGLGRLLLYPPLPVKYGGETATPLDQKDAKAEVRTDGKSAKVFWTNELGTLIETISFDFGVLLIRYELHLNNPAWQAVFPVEPSLSAAEQARCVFLPDTASLQDVYRPCPAYEVLRHEPSGRSLGVVATDLMPEAAVRSSDNEYLLLTGARMAVQVKPLHWEQQKEYRGGFGLFLSKDAAPPWDAVLPGAPRDLRLLKLEADKLIYAPGEAGKVLVTLRNLAKTEKLTTVQVLAAHGLGEFKPVASQRVALPPFTQQTVSLPWQPGTQEGGIGLGASLEGLPTLTLASRPPGNLLPAAAGALTAACIVAKDWAQYFQLGIVYPDEKTSAHIARMMRDSYLSVGHCFAWYEANGSLVPATDKYMSHQDFEKSKPGFVKFNQEMHALGLKTNFYWDPFPNSQPGDLELATKDPTIVAYHPNGQPYNGFHGLGTDPYLKFSRDFVISQFKGSIDMFGWDSMMFDDITFFRVEDTPFTAFYMRNWKGEMAGKELAPDADTAGEKWLNEVKAGVRAKYPDFVFMGNCLGPDDFLSGTGMGPKTYAAAEIPLSELGGGGESVTGKTGVGTWVGLKQVLDTQHQGREGLGLGNKPNYVYIPIPYGGEESTKGSFALYFANRHHLYGWWPAPAGSLFAQAEVQYLRFATRFCEFLYPDNARWFAPGKVDFLKVDAPGVWWQDYVYERPLPKGRQLLIHLVQPPQGELMWRQSTAPAMLKNVPVQLTLAAGEKVTGAWSLSPDTAQESNALKPQTAGAQVKLTVPELSYYALVVVNVEK